MLIHAYKRNEPISVLLGTIDYKFKPHPDNAAAHVADVADEAHAAILLAIREAYIEYGQEPPIAYVPPAPQSAEQRDRSALEDELGFSLADGKPLGDGSSLSVSTADGFTDEAAAFAKAEAERKAQEEADEAEAEAQRKADLAAAAEAEAAAKKYVLTSADTSIDLKTMDDAALRAFAKEQGIKGINGRSTGDKIRDAIVAALVPAAGA